MSSLLLAIIIAVSSLFVGDIAGMSRMEEVSAGSATYKVGNWRTNCKIGNKTFYFEASNHTVKKINCSWKEDCSTYNICVKAGKKKNVLVKDAEQSFATNGTYLYYVKYKNYRANIYRMTLKTKKSKKVLTAPKKTSYYLCLLDGIKGKYIYYTTMPDNGDLGYHIYAYNTKTKKNKQIAKDMNLHVWGNQIILSEVTTSYENINIYFAKLDGTKKRKITSAVSYFVYNNKLYWVQQRYNGSIEQCQYRLGCCDKNGKKKKTLSKWKKNISSIPYFDMTTKEKKKMPKRIRSKSWRYYL